MYHCYSAEVSLITELLIIKIFMARTIVSQWLDCLVIYMHPCSCVWLLKSISILSDYRNESKVVGYVPRVLFTT